MDVGQQIEELIFSKKIADSQKDHSSSLSNKMQMMQQASNKSSSSAISQPKSA